MERPSPNLRFLATSAARGEEGRTFNNLTQCGQATANLSVSASFEVVCGGEREAEAFH